jgi:hypothetical protein
MLYNRRFFVDNGFKSVHFPHQFMDEYKLKRATTLKAEKEPPESENVLSDSDSQKDHPL